MQATPFLILSMHCILLWSQSNTAEREFVKLQKNELMIFVEEKADKCSQRLSSFINVLYIRVHCTVYMKKILHKDIAITKQCPRKMQDLR